MSKLYAYNFPDKVVELENNSIIYDSYNTAYWCANIKKAGYNINTIISIMNNTDNYFDFSKNFIDIGARVGEFTFHLGTLFNHTYAFEPNKKSAALIYVNSLLADNIDKVDVIEAYLSDCKKNILYNGWCNANDNNILANDMFNTVKTDHDGEHLDGNMYQLTTHTLDEYSFDNVGFIKIDVEGAEYEVLKGAVGTIMRNNCPPILFEILDDDWFKTKEIKEKYKNDLYSLLYSLGYSDIIQYGEDHQNYLALK